MPNLDVIHELYRAFREGDDDAFRAVCTPDVEWIQNEGFPNGDTRRGADAVIEGVFRKFDEDWSRFGFEIEEIHDAGDAVIVIGAYVGEHRASGRTLRAAAVHAYDLANGRVRRFRQFTDTKVIWDVLEERVESR